MTWTLPVALLGITGGSVLFAVSLSRRWVNWCNDKPFLIPYVVLAAGFWGIMGGLHYLLNLLMN